jgi:replicative DNA helicase
MNIALGAEKALIGSLLIEPQRLLHIRETIAPEFFHDALLGSLFRFMCQMADERLDIDTVTLVDRATQANFDRNAVVDCLSGTPSASHIGTYSRLVAEAYYGRKALEACRTLAKDQNSDNLKDVEAWIVKKQALSAPQLFNYATGLHDVLDAMQHQEQSESLKTGVEVLDRCWHGSKPGEINTWAAATNVGKSLMLLNLMHRSAASGYRCLYVGTEMTAHETVHRHLSIVSGIANWKIRQPALDLAEIGQVTDALSNSLSTLPVSILDAPEPRLEDIDAAIVASKAQVVFLDYLERFNLPKLGRDDAMRLRIKEFMRRSKTMARIRGVTIHLAAQLSRQAYGLEERRPTMAEISESSAVEKESDRIMLMWTPKAKQPQDPTAQFKIIEVIQAKNRHGSRGLVFDMKLNERTLEITEANNEGN